MLFVIIIFANLIEPLNNLAIFFFSSPGFSFSPIFFLVPYQLINFHFLTKNYISESG